MSLREAIKAARRTRAPSTGKCPVCSYTVRLRKDGTIGRHLLYGPPEGRPCTGEGKPPKGAA